MESNYIKPEKEELVSLFHNYKEQICAYDTDFITEMRLEALEQFSAKGFPARDEEKWKNTNLVDSLAKSYHFSFHNPEESVDIDKIFRCEIHNFETLMFTQLNGWYVYNNSPVTTLGNGVIAGSLQHAKKMFPDIVNQHYGKYADAKTDGFIALNTAFAQDGLFIYVPDNVIMDKPIQMVNLVNTGIDLFLQPRNLIILGKNSKLTMVYCDDSIKHKSSFINSVTEVFSDENSQIDFYKLQNKDNASVVITNTAFYQNAGSRADTNTLTFNGGIIRNETAVYLNQPRAEINAYGLYLVDKEQHIDNQLSIFHNAPETRSNEQFKGIIDDNGSAVFNGYIHVKRDAQKTEAYQSNKNILLTDTARITSKPFLEIYADDVKCSHGSTVGQLDSNALFYLKSRGICDRNAKMLLMYAFASEIVSKIQIPVLRDRIDTMSTKRLKGELSICDQCVLHCKENEMINFEIDMSKL